MKKCSFVFFLLFLLWGNLNSQVEGTGVELPKQVPVSVNVQIRNEMGIEYFGLNDIEIQLTVEKRLKSFGILLTKSKKNEFVIDIFILVTRDVFYWDISFRRFINYSVNEKNYQYYGTTFQKIQWITGRTSIESALEMMMHDGVDELLIKITKSLK